jgi:hypothetical protein
MELVDNCITCGALVCIGIVASPSRMLFNLNIKKMVPFSDTIPSLDKSVAKIAKDVHLNADLQ